MSTISYTKYETDFLIQNLKKDLNFGILGKITTTQTLIELNALVDGVYRAQTEGNYANGLVAKKGVYTTFRKVGTTWTIENETDMPVGISKVSNDDNLITSKGVFFDKISNKTFLKPLNNINVVEERAANTIKYLKVNGYDGELNLVLVKSGEQITNFGLNNSVDLFIDLTNSIYENENGIVKYKKSQNFKNNIIYVEAILDLNIEGDFIYSYDASSNPNLRILATNEISSVPETTIADSILTLKSDGNNEPILKNSTIYLKFYVSEPIVLGSVSVNVINLPTENPAWIECGIFPPDNGFGTAPIITSSDQIEIRKRGFLRLPLEHKLLEVGEYAIAFKTNVDCFETVSDVNSFRGYDAPGVMPKVALNLKFPHSDKYGKFLAFSLHSYQKTKNVHFPADWHLKYEPENFYIGCEDLNPNLQFYWHSEGLAGNKTIRLSQSLDGGKTKTFLHSNNIDENFEELHGNVMNCISHMSGLKRVVYVNFKYAKIFKFVIENNLVSWSEITPTAKSNSISSLPVASYAPLIIFKNYLYWGEYQDPDRPRIHKMNIDSGLWSVSIEKPRAGENGARHVHYLYKSPIDSNVLWAVWGDASNGGGQGLSKLNKTGNNDNGPDAWEQWTTGVHDENKTTLPYPTGIIEVFGLGIVGAGDQPPTHLIVCNNEGNAGKNLFMPLNFKDQSAPITETCHRLAIDDNRTIYYMTVEANPYMSLYASPFPYTEKFRISKYWQQALAGEANYSNGIITMGQFSFPKITFRNIAENNNISKVPYVGNADAGNVVTILNKLIENLQKSNVLQTFDEQGSDKNQSFWPSGNQFENFN